jgi:tellurite methyltransferase
VERFICGYHQDDLGDWVAELVCGHNQHVRHRPPFQLRPWVLTEPERLGRLGTPLDCPLCDRAELPEATRLVRSSPDWNEDTLPKGLRRAHRLASGTWGRIVVKEGRLFFGMAAGPPVEAELTPDTPGQAIPPDVEHEVRLAGPVRFSIDFLAVDRAEPVQAPSLPDTVGARAPLEEGGDPACWAGIVCPECGAVTAEGYHRPGCAAAPAGGGDQMAPAGRPNSSRNT